MEPVETPEQLLALLKREQELRGLTETALSEMVVGNRTLFSKLRNAKELPRRTTLMKIATFLGMDTGVLASRIMNVPVVGRMDGVNRWLRESIEINRRYLQEDQRDLERKLAAFQALEVEIANLNARIAARRAEIAEMEARGQVAPDSTPPSGSPGMLAGPEAHNDHPPPRGDRDD
jgi:transcriptional regulator with XRE-family HTH domain